MEAFAIPQVRPFTPSTLHPHHGRPEERHSTRGRLHACARTYVASVTRPRGFNNKGTFDEFRCPKMVFRTVRDKLAGRVGGR